MLLQHKKQQNIKKNKEIMQCNNQPTVDDAKTVS
jgi:hypothetical protein